MVVARDPVRVGHDERSILWSLRLAIHANVTSEVMPPATNAPAISTASVTRSAFSGEAAPLGPPPRTPPSPSPSPRPARSRRACPLPPSPPPCPRRARATRTPPPQRRVCSRRLRGIGVGVPELIHPLQVLLELLREPLAR